MTWKAKQAMYTDYVVWHAIQNHISLVSPIQAETLFNIQLRDNRDIIYQHVLTDISSVCTTLFLSRSISDKWLRMYNVVSGAFCVACGQTTNEQKPVRIYLTYVYI